MTQLLTKNEKRYFNRELLYFAFPIMLEQFLLKVSAITGSALLGQIGKVELSASSLSITILSILEVAILGVTLATTVTVAQNTKNKDEWSKYATAGFLFAGAIAVVIALFSVLFAENLIELMFSGAEDIVKQKTAGYYRILSLSGLFYVVDFNCSAIMRGFGDSKTPFRITLFTNTANIAMTALCLFVFGFDYRSAAICYVCAIALSGAIKFIMLISGKYGFKFSFSKPLSRHFTKLIKIGLPSMLERSLIQFAALGMQMVVSMLDTTTLAGYQAANNTISFTYTFTAGLEVALVSLVAKYKFENKQAANQVVKASYKYGFIITAIAGIIFAVFAPYFISLFANGNDVVAEGAYILRLLVLTIPLTTAFQAGIGALKTGNDIYYSLAVTVIAPNLMRLPLAYYLVSSCSMGFLGLYIGCVADYVLRAFVVLWRIFKKRWLTD